MELSEYIRKTIVGIVSAVESVQKELADKESNAIINPSLVDKDKKLIDHKFGKRSVDQIEFTVGINASESSGSEGGIGVFTGVLSMGGRAKNDGAIETVNTVKFTIPVSLPVNDELEKKLMKANFSH